MIVRRSDCSLAVTAGRYSVAYDANDPWHLVLTADGASRILSLASGVHTPDGWDAVGEPSLTEVLEGDQETVLRFAMRSRTWRSAETVVRLRESDLDIQAVVEGEGRVEVVSLLEGAVESLMPDERASIHCIGGRNRRPLRAYSLPSRTSHKTVFTPQPESYHRPVRPYYEDAMVTAAVTFGPDRYDTFFSPGIFCFVLGDADETRFISVGVCAPEGENQYHTFRYCGGDGFGILLEYDGLLEVDGTFASPRLRIGFAADRYSALKDYVSHLRQEGYVKFDAAKHIPEWWLMPIFCGWGQQVYWNRIASQGRALPFAGSSSEAMSNLPSDNLSLHDMATQDAYEEMVRMLDEAGVPYGTLTIDAGWATSGTLPRVNTDKWPDMRGFIDRMHEAGKKVLLWICTWTTDEVPQTLLMDHEAGLVDLPDPTKPEFAEALTQRISELIGPDGLDADGFKLDFTRTHNFTGYRPHQPMYGVEILRHYVKTIYDAAKAAKPDALVETHCANPYFSDITDVLRLNDMFFETTEVNPLMRFRADMARIACPEWPIDCDNDPFYDRESWMSYMRFQPEIGIPSLYTVTHMSLSEDEVRQEDLREIASIWRSYIDRIAGGRDQEEHSP